MRMRQFAAALCLTLELIKHSTILNHQVGNKFQRDIALQFFVACQPDNSHSASPEHLDQRVAAKDFLSAGELTRRRACDIARAFVSHIEKISIIKMGRKFKAGGRSPLQRRFGFAPAGRNSSLRMRHFASTTTFGRVFLRERPPRGRCLAGSSRWKTPSDPWQLFARTSRRQYDRVGIAESVAPTRADSSAKYRRTLADRFRQQQRNFFEQATDSSAGSAERRRSNHNRR